MTSGARRRVEPELTELVGWLILEAVKRLPPGGCFGLGRRVADGIGRVSA